jgi:hypothetical protein
MDEAIRQLSREAHRDDCSRDAAKQYFMALEAKIAWMEQEAHAASVTIERLLKLLRPFGDRAAAYDPQYYTDDEPAWWHLAPPTVGDLRRARAALGEGKE